METRPGLRWLELTEALGRDGDFSLDSTLLSGAMNVLIRAAVDTMLETKFLRLRQLTLTLRRHPCSDGFGTECAYTKA